MKLHETIQFEQPLFESFQDLKRIIRDTFIEVVGSDSLGSHSVQEFAGNYRVTYTAYKNLMKSHEESLKTIRNKNGFPTRKEMTTPEGLLKLVKFIVKHPLLENNPEWKDTGNWIRVIRDKSLRIQYAFSEFLERTSSILDQINRFESDPQRQKPEITTVKKTPKYHIYKPENYMGARKICNMFNTTWCVGADPEMFTGYGKDAGREMYVVSLNTKKVISFHVSDSSYIITDHSNRNEVSKYNERGEGMKAIVADLQGADISAKEAEEMFSEVFHDLGLPMELIKRLEQTYNTMKKKKINKMEGAKNLIDSEDLVAQVQQNSLYIGKRLSDEAISYVLFFSRGGSRWGVSMSSAGEPITQNFDISDSVVAGKMALAYAKLTMNDKQVIFAELDDANDESGGEFERVTEMFDLLML